MLDIKKGGYYELRKDIVKTVKTYTGEKDTVWKGGHTFELYLINEDKNECSLLDVDFTTGYVSNARLDIPLNDIDKFFIKGKKPKRTFKEILRMIGGVLALIFLGIPFAIVVSIIWFGIWTSYKLGIMSEETYEKHTRK
jgi:hypothetical protein